MASRTRILKLWSNIISAGFGPEQPNGPYFLLGHSFGGMVVFETAQRLLAMGERIACLILPGYPRAASIVATSFLTGELRLATARPSQAHHELLDEREVIYYAWRLNLRRKGLDQIDRLEVWPRRRSHAAGERHAGEEMAPGILPRADHVILRPRYQALR